jgi:type III secretion protein U
MSGESSEQKTDPASHQKLEKQRKKGVVAQAAEMSNYIAQALVLIFLMLSALWLISLMERSIDTGLSSITQPFETAMSVTANASVQMYIRFVAPILVLAMSTGVLVTLIRHKGIVFAVDPIIPKASNISPSSGLKRMFGFRSRVEFALSLVRLFIWGGAVAAISSANFGRILTSGICGLPCIVEVTFDVLLRLLVVATILYLLFAVSDVLVQTFLFAKDQRMTKSEVKREAKDQFGSNEVRNARRNFAKELEQAAESVGRERATMLVYFGDQAVAIRFHPKVAPVPTLSAKTTDRAASRELRDYIRGEGQREAESEAVVRGMINRPLGSAVPVSLHEALKDAIVEMYSKG